MSFMKKEVVLKSDFPQKEEFSYNDVPKYFKSVTIRSLRNIKNYCARTLRQKYNNKYEPNTLKAMLQTIDGEFDHAYAMLTDDYNSRLRNLQTAYQEGLADIEKEFLEFRQLASEHDQAFQDYDEIHSDLIGRRLDQKLLFSSTRLDNIEHQYKNLQDQAKE